MWAYIAAYKTPHDDDERRQQRVHVDYPIVVDRVIGLGELPTVRLQRALARDWPAGPGVAALDRVLVWAHWSWFMVPHAALLYILARHPARFRARGRDDLRRLRHRRELLLGDPDGAAVVCRAQRARRTARGAAGVRRMMVEYGEYFWRDGWSSLYSVFGGNPLAAMPSLHFATSAMAALLLAEVRPAGGSARLRVRGHARRSRSSTWASTTSSTCSGARR